MTPCLLCGRVSCDTTRESWMYAYALQSEGCAKYLREQMLDAARRVGEHIAKLKEERILKAILNDSNLL